ncbi:hypothetical protein JS756_13580 [Streptomyces actuosus]|uniref:Membrane protein YfcA n=1 Tax=Streptomyces actuosus TaxID=1885 RepID=A0ABS2VPU5_STRAS|nr:hypothetical protein [Streptomyces actuosus]MBN0045123.1 hypothetical protein [Streptomyces actuosus]
MTDRPYQEQPHQRPYRQEHQPYQPQHQPNEGHDPYAQQQGWSPQGESPQEEWGRQQAWPQQGQWPQQQGWAQQPQAQPGDDPRQHTQQWQGQTWETQLQQPVAAPEATQTAYLPPQNPDAPPQHAYAPAYPAPGEPQAQHRAPQRQAQPLPEEQQPRQPQAPAGAVAGAASGPAYGPATLSGNTRVTDAQRARLEGRSPIIEPGMQPAALTALLGLLLSGAAAIGSYALLVPLVALQAVTAAGWFRLNGMWPARQGIALAFLGALAADAAVSAAGREHGPAAILGTLGVWVLLCLVLQLRSHADPDERMYGLMATVVSAALAIIATGYLAAPPEAVSVGALAVAAAVLARALPLATPASVVVALLAATGAGIAVGGATGMGTGGALLGASAAVCALIGHRVASFDYPSRFVHVTAGVALPLSAAAPVVYVLGRALG